MKTVADLVEGGVLRFAALPPNNPPSLDFAHYTIPLLEHDYPAKTAAMWNAVYRALGVSLGNIMLIGDPKRAAEIFAVFRGDEKYLGGGAGVGFKDKSLPCLDEIDYQAKAIGAVNFILKTAGGKLKGYNTDGLGFAQSLAERFRRRRARLPGKKIVVLGAGGTSNAVAFALAEQDVRLVIVNRTVEKAQELAQRINQFFHLIGERKARFGGEERTIAEARDADAVVNVSTKGSAGMLEQYSALAPIELPATEENVRKNHQAAAEILAVLSKQAIVSDVVLVSGLTVMLARAQEAGFEILNGVPMVVNQGVEALWLSHQRELKASGVTKETVRDIMQQAALG